MNKSSKYTGLIIFIVSVLALILMIVFLLVMPKYKNSKNLDSNISKNQSILKQKRATQASVIEKKKNIQESLMKAHKKVYAPTETGLENETLFFTLYSDLMEMIHTNGIKIKSINYNYNPETDPFVKEGGKENYFVCDINMEIISNYVNLGKFIQDVYQYPYYIRINEIDIKPYPKDKKILISNISLRLYAHTQPQEELQESAEEITLEGASTSLPQ